MLLHGGEDAVAIGLGGGQDSHSGARLGWGGVGEQHYAVGGEAEPGAGQQVGHRQRIVDRAREVVEGAEFAAPIGTARGMLRGGAGRLIGVDADQQGAAGLSAGERRKEHQERRNEPWSHGNRICPEDRV